MNWLPLVRADGALVCEHSMLWDEIAVLDDFHPLRRPDIYVSPGTMAKLRAHPEMAHDIFEGLKQVRFPIGQVGMFKSFDLSLLPEHFNRTDSQNEAGS